VLPVECVEVVVHCELHTVVTAVHEEGRRYSDHPPREADRAGPVRLVQRDV
jgi:hypothetical protein